MEGAGASGVAAPAGWYNAASGRAGPAGEIQSHAMFRYRCSACNRELKRRECVILDDPWAPFGPERVCPFCQSGVTLHAKPVVIALAGALAGLLGFGMGCVLQWIMRSGG
jgi:hypothetical protein